MLSALKRAALALVAVAAAYTVMGVPEAHSSAPLTSEILADAEPQAEGERCTLTGCEARCGGVDTCSSFRANSTGGCTYVCKLLKPKSPSEVK